MQTVLAIALQVGLMVLFLFESERMPAGTWNEDYLSLSQTKGLGGLFEILIVFHHCGQRVVYSYLGRSLGLTSGLTLVSLMGFPLVGYFFFCSGYGLCRSYRTKGAYLDGFLRRRPLPLLAVFYACNTLYLLGRLACGETFDGGRLVRLALGAELANPNAWYAVVLPLMYVLFYVSARCAKDDGGIVRSLFVGTVLLMVAGAVVTTLFYDGSYRAFVGVWWYDSVFLFPVGYLYGLKGDAVAGWMRRNYAWGVRLSCLAWLGAFVPSAFLNFLALPGTTTVPVRFAISLLTLALHGIAATGFVWTMLAVSLKRKVRGRVLAFFGSITLELYLMHGFFVQLFWSPFYDMGSGILEIGSPVAYILAVLVAGTLVALAFRVLTRRLLAR